MKLVFLWLGPEPVVLDQAWLARAGLGKIAAECWRV